MDNRDGVAMLTTLKQIAILLLVALAGGFTLNAVSPKGIALFGNWDVAKGVVSAGAKDDVVSHDIEIQSVDEAKRLFDQSSVLFVDARDPEAFYEGRIRGAVLMFVYDYDTYFESFVTTYPKSQSIVTYCSGRECEDSHKLAQYLMDDGYANVRVFIDGFPVWKSEGLPIESGD